MGCGEPEQPEGERVDGVLYGPVADVVLVQPLTHKAVYKVWEASIVEGASVFGVVLDEHDECCPEGVEDARGVDIPCAYGTDGVAVLDELEGKGGGLDGERAETTGGRRDVEAVCEEVGEEVSV